MVRLGRVVYKHNSISVLLDGRPRLLVAKVARNVPEFKIDFTECRHAWWRASLEVHNSTKNVIIRFKACLFHLPAANGRSVQLRRTFLEFTNNVGNSALSSLGRTNNNNLNFAHFV